MDLDKIINGFISRGEELKKLDLINDFKVEKSSIENIFVDSNGELVYDVYIDLSIIPKQSVKFVDLNFKILRNGIAL